jgi:hypothetical protein
LAAFHGSVKMPVGGRRIGSLKFVHAQPFRAAHNAHAAELRIDKSASSQDCLRSLY